MSNKNNSRHSPKNIIVCSDGTGNSQIKGRGTNVFKLFEALDLNGFKEDPGIPQQVAIYDDGVGTQSVKFISAVSGATGLGLAHNVRHLYAEICRIYNPGDKLYLFGFSRGAFTVRTLASVIIHCGIIDWDKWETDKQLMVLVAKAWAAHRSEYRSILGEFRHRTNLRKKITSDGKSFGPLEKFRQEYAIISDPERRLRNDLTEPDRKLGKVKFVGVWDTVDAVGLPWDGLSNLVNSLFYRFKFPDQNLSPNVEKACQALAIDEERHTFQPLLWNEAHEDHGRSEKRIEQVWFAGAHSNVGGGYPKQGLSLVTLNWMLSHATLAGLKFLKSVEDDIHLRRNVNDHLYDSRAGLAVYYRYKPRNIAVLCGQVTLSDTLADRIMNAWDAYLIFVGAKSAVKLKPRIHTSVLERVIRGTEGYAPQPLLCEFEVATTPNIDGNSDPVPIDIPAFQAELKKHAKDYERLFKQASVWIELRRRTHMLLFASTATIFYLLWETSASTDGSITEQATTFLDILAGGMSSVGQALYANQSTSGVVIGLLLLFWIAGNFMKKRIQGIYSRYWRKVVGSFRKSL